MCQLLGNQFFATCPHQILTVYKIVIQMAEKDPKQPYKLRCSLIGHSLDVRGVTTTQNGEIITVSRDKTSILWTEDAENGCIYKQTLVYEGHTGYVMCTCAIPGSGEFPEGLTLTGSKDSTILVFPRYSSKSIHTLTGHTDAVSCLTWKDDLLISGSWDHSLRVWKDWQCVAQLKGHSAPVWSVIVMATSPSGENLIISASADKTLKCWKDGKDIVTYQGHTDCIRGVSALDSERFLSCSNDASVRQWNISGDCLATYYGHTNFIYSMCCVGPSGAFITGGEDRTLRAWDPFGANTFTQFLPAQSVWGVAALPNGDIVAGSSDGICRVFTQSVDRHADATTLADFETSLSDFKITQPDIGGIKKSDLPDQTFLHTPGKRDGQTVMIRVDEKVVCYSWSSAKGEWSVIGEVVGAAGSSASTSGKVLYEGKEYDYVFDVDLDEGRMLKLPYNSGEDPWEIAQAFIHRHQLPQDYLDQVAKFITQNASVSPHLGQKNEYFDPFTGGARYIPSYGGTNNLRASDPFTGGGRYVPSFTPEVQATSLSPPSQYFPQTVPLKFDGINRAGILSKLEESNALVSDALSKEELEGVVDSVTRPDVDVSLLSPMDKALQWPPERIWPVLDVLRLALRSQKAQERWLCGGKGAAIVGLMVGFLGNSTPIPTQLLAIRSLANMASHEPGRRVLASSRSLVLPPLLSMTPYPNKNVEIAAATLLLNYSTIFTGTQKFDDLCELLSAAGTLALTVSDPEAQFRTLVAIGTLLTGDKEARSLAHSLDINTLIQKLAHGSDLEKVGECARHILNVLKL